MSGMYLYCQNPVCRAYLGSLGGDECHLCGWSNPDAVPDDEAAQRAQAQEGQQQ